MGKLIEILFHPPPMPPIHLPLAARLVPGVQEAIWKAYEVVYYRGVYDGFIAGVLLTLLFVPSIKNRVAKGASDVLPHL